MLQGSRVEGRRIFGVGSASNIRNKELALSTAQNRGRSEIARLVSTYSASLMRDYQSSLSGSGAEEQGAQAVEQVIRTYSAELLSGAQQSDAWYHPDTSTWYVRMVLNVDRSEAIAAVASASGGKSMANWVRDNQARVLAELEQEMRPLPRPPRESASWSGMSPVNNFLSAGSQNTKPDWVDGACERSRYLCGSGEAATPTEADQRARAALSLIFEANIQAVSKSFQKAVREVSQRTGETWKEVETVSDHSMVSTNKTIVLSDIVERWVSPQKRVWSLAVVDRAKASSVLRQQMTALDKKIEDELLAARRSEDPISKLPKLRAVLRSLSERAALEADYRVVSTNGRAPVGMVKWQDVVALIEETSTNLSIGLHVTGDAAEHIRGCMEDAFTSKGYQLSYEQKGEDVQIEVEMRSADLGKLSGGQVVQANLVVRLINGRSRRTIRTLRDSTKATRRSVSAAERTAAVKLCKKKIPVILRDIDRLFN